MRLALRHRMILAAVVPVAAVACVLTLIFVFQSLQNLERGLRERGIAMASQLAAAAEFPIFTGNRDSVLALVHANMRSGAEVIGVSVTDSKGVVLARAGTSNVTNWPVPGTLAGVRDFGRHLQFSHPVLRTTIDVDDIYSGESATSGADARLLGQVVVELSPGAVLDQRDRLIATALLVALVGVVLGALLARWIASGVNNPLLEASSMVEKIARGDDQARMAEDVGPLTALAKGLNSMAARVAMTEESLRQQVAETTAELRDQKEAAERATAAKSHFLASASHDLRQPMLALGLFVERLITTEAARNESQLVRSIAASVRALQELLDAILDVSRLDSGSVVPQISEFDLNELLQRVVFVLGPLATDKGLTLCARPTALKVRSDRLLVERMLINIVTNSVRYTSRGGILVGCRRRNGAVVVEVWDTGKGIPLQRQPEIFEEYVQLDNPERDRSKGLGLGLAICRRLADLLHIPIGLRSRENRGSVFWLQLIAAEMAGDGRVNQMPAVTFDDAALRSPAATAFSRRGVDKAAPGGSVMVVESDVSTATELRILMTGWGLDVSLVSGLHDARQQMRSSPTAPEIVLLGLGAGSGRDAIADAVCFGREHAGVRLLLIAAEGNEVLQQSAAGAELPLLRKPVQPGRLRAALRHATLTDTSSE